MPFSRQGARGAPEPEPEAGAAAPAPVQAGPGIAPSGFRHEAYAAENADIAAALGDDPAALAAHYRRYGIGEMRGLRTEQAIRVEAVLLCETGHALLRGWADRRLVRRMSLTLSVGYASYGLDGIEPCWYDRADVVRATGDSARPQGFVALVRLADLAFGGSLGLRFNDQELHAEEAPRLLSPERFLQAAMSACSVFADMPVGASQEAARRLLPQVRSLWAEVLGGMRATLAFSHRAEAPVERSVVIVVHARADMLLAQLEALARPLREARAEVVVVGNALAGAEVLAEQLAAFCQIHDLPVSLHLVSGNSGFSAANNLGARAARGAVLVFMNPDVFPPEPEGFPGDPEGQAAAFLAADPGEDLHGALLYYGDGLLMHSGMYVAADRAVDARRGAAETVLRVEHFGKGLTARVTDPEAPPEPPEGAPLLASAALWKMRRATFEALGGLPEDYVVAYYEDAEFCLRLRESGRRVVIDRGARFVHLEGVGRAAPPEVRAFMWLNRALFTQRFAGSVHVAGPEIDLEAL